MTVPGPQSSVNAIQSPALSDLGLGDQVKQQLQDQLDEQKKKKLMSPGTNDQPGMGAALASGTQTSAFSPAVSMLFGDAR